MNVANFIDHTLLRPDCTARDLELLCQEAIEHKFHAVCIPPFFVQQASRILDRHPTRIATVIGFPLGYSAVAAKIEEIKRAINEQSKLFELKEQNWDLLITNAQTGESYRQDQYLIHKNMTLSVRKVRAQKGKSLKDKLDANPVEVKIKEPEPEAGDEGAGEGEDETARMQEVMKATSSEYQTNPNGQYNSWAGGIRPGYVCHRSGKLRLQ